MRIENIPVLLGIIVGLLGAAVAWDAWTPDRLGPMRDRRRRLRAALDTRGEALVGVGVLLLGGALIGRDWRFETPAVLLGAALVLWGGVRNRAYIKEMLLFRGAARRGLEKPPGKPGKMRIR